MRRRKHFHLFCMKLRDLLRRREREREREGKREDDDGPPIPKADGDVVVLPLQWLTGEFRVSLRDRITDGEQGRRGEEKGGKRLSTGWTKRHGAVE